MMRLGRFYEFECAQCRYQAVPLNLVARGISNLEIGNTGSSEFTCSSEGFHYFPHSGLIESLDHAGLGAFGQQGEGGVRLVAVREERAAAKAGLLAEDIITEVDGKKVTEFDDITNIVLDKLRDEGANEVELKKVRAPIGLDIGAVSPEEVALAILAEIVAERRGGSGVPLSHWRRA